MERKQREPTAAEWKAARDYKEQIKVLRPELSAEQLHVIRTTFLVHLMRFNEEHS